MQILLEEVCQYIRNWFCSYDNGDVYTGSFQITNGEIVGVGMTKTPPIIEGTYYRIIGSYKTNGVYLAGTDVPINDSFTGQVWLMHPSPAFLALVAEIATWQAKYGTADSTNMSPFTSESFGGYSYSKGGVQGSGSGQATSWQGQYASRLNAWRKI